ncbi:MAG TPA: 6-phosphofructokinase [Armatimonadetes bacterium]|nr:6-phosphofructokinase [Armatimonadota bacterium]
MKKIAVLTSGGDAPGMNACLRAVVRAGIHSGLTVVGVYRGYTGLIAGETGELNLSSVSGIIHRGGTIIRTGRCPEFFHPEGRERAYRTLEAQGIEGLIVIGGNGSYQGAWLLHQEWGVPVIGVPGTIDNDIAGTDYTIGFDTAVETAVACIDKIRDTADSHERIFVVEVMGRHAGFIALETALAGGAEAVLVPEYPEFTGEDVCTRLEAGKRRGKRSFIVVVAEGAASGVEVARLIAERTGAETRATVLGHLQRGGSPTVDDRVLGSRCGAAAVEALRAGETAKMVCQRANEIVLADLEIAWQQKKPLDRALYELVNVLGS